MRTVNGCRADDRVRNYGGTRVVTCGNEGARCPTEAPGGGRVCLCTTVGLLPAGGVPWPCERGVVGRPCSEKRHRRASDARPGLEPPGPWRSVFLFVVPAPCSCPAWLRRAGHWLVSLTLSDRWLSAWRSGAAGFPGVGRADTLAPCRVLSVPVVWLGARLVRGASCVAGGVSGRFPAAVCKCALLFPAPLRRASDGPFLLGNEKTKFNAA